MTAPLRGANLVYAMLDYIREHEELHAGFCMDTERDTGPGRIYPDSSAVLTAAERQKTAIDAEFSGTWVNDLHP